MIRQSGRKAALPEMEETMMEDKPMIGEEVLQQILGALNGNGMQQAANGVYELCAYVDSMTHKVEDMTEEIASSTAKNIQFSVTI